MANSVLVLAESGFGKSTSMGHIPKEELGTDEDIEGLNPEETLLINIKGKPLPYRGWKRGRSPLSEDDPTGGGNYLATVDAAKIIKTIKYFGTNRDDIKNIVIDDFQYLMADEFVKNALKTGYEKFSKLAKNAYDVIDAGIGLAGDRTFIVLSHLDEFKQGSYKMKTIGKMLDEKVTLEGLFTILLYGKSNFDQTTKKSSKVFVTNFDGEYPAKSPVGMFKGLYIPNDLGFVIKKMNEYYNGE